MNELLFQDVGESCRDAVLSKCGTYRYRLTRRWGSGPRQVVWMMMNPSTADAMVDDPTIRKCIGFSKRWGFDALDVVNLFAYRSTDPKALAEAADPLGPERPIHIAGAIMDAELLVCAWGCEADLMRLKKMGWKAELVIQAIRESRPNLPIVCLGKSKSGNPYHPLMLAYETGLVPFEVTA